MLNKNTVFFVGAHPDDEVYGAGSTLAKFIRQGKKIIVVILSYGEMSSALMKRKIIVKERVKEDKLAQKVLGITESYYFGLREGHFLEDAKKKNIQNNLLRLLRKYRPSIVITHSSDDFHKDHQDTFKIVSKTLDEWKVKDKPRLYSCISIWGVSIRNNNKPKLFVDVTDTFYLKIKALKSFKTQKLTFFTLIWSVYLRALIYGSKIRKKYAEMFYIIR